MLLKKKLKVKDNTITILTKILSKRDEDSYNMASQMVNDVINQERTPEKDTNANTEEPTSPIVLKTARRSKRKLSITNDNDEEKNLIFSSEVVKTPEKDECLSKCIVPLDPASPEILKEEKVIKVEKSDSGSPETNKAAPSKISPPYGAKINLTLTKDPLSAKTNPSLTNDPSQGAKSSSANDNSKISSTSVTNNKNNSVLVSEKLKTSFSADVKNETLANEKTVKVSTTCDNSNTKESEKSKTKWHLKKSRMLTANDKLKQTVLSTAVFEKKVDLSTLEEYNGGCAPPQVKKLDIITKSCSLSTKENTNETFFEPLVTSTVNELDNTAVNKTPVKKSPSKSPLVESTNKVK